MPILGSFGITGWHDSARYQGPGVTIGRSGASIGTATYTGFPYWPLNTALFVSNFKGNHPRWVYWLLHLIDFRGFNSGSAQPSLNRNYLKQIPVSLPPLNEQQRIAEVMGALDDLIDTNERLVELHQYMCDVAIAAEVAKGAGSITQLSEIALFENKKRIPLSAAERRQMPGPFPYYGANGQIDSVGEFLFEEPRLLVGEDGTVMTDSGLAVTRLVWGQYWVNNHAHVLRGVGETSTAVLRVLLRNLNVRERVTGAVQPKLSMGSLKAASVFVPTSERFASAVDTLTEAEMALSDEIAELRRTRDELLPLLMSGKVRVQPEEVAA